MWSGYFPKTNSTGHEKIPTAEFYVQAGEELNLSGRTFDYIVISETLNLAVDVQLILERLKAVSSGETRLLVNVYNALWRPLISLATAMGCESGILQAIGYQRIRSPGYWPWLGGS